MYIVNIAYIHRKHDIQRAYTQRPIELLMKYKTGHIINNRCVTKIKIKKYDFQ